APATRLSHARSLLLVSVRPIAVLAYIAGRNAAGVPLGWPGMISMNAGRLSFSVPNPYATHDPAGGRGSRPEPVAIMFLAVKWSSLSWCSDLMKQRSSISLLVSGNRSEAHRPDWPQRFQWKGLFSKEPVGAKVNLGLAMVAG